MANNSNSRVVRIAIVIGLILLLLLCITPVAYRVGLDYDQQVCFNRLAKEFNVDPKYIEIQNAILEQLKAKINVGIDQKDAINWLKNNYSVVVEPFPGSEPNQLDYIRIRKCWLPQNDFTFLFFYSGSGNLKKIEAFIWD